jgi:predicted ATPase
LWAGPEVLAPSVLRGVHPVQGTRRKNPVRLRLGFAGDEFSYSLELGLPVPSSSAFMLDPVIKRECIWSGPRFRPAAVLVDRSGPLARTRGDGSEWHTLSQHLPSFDSMMARCADPQNAPEMLTLREQVRSWRFYDHFRTDATAPARAPQVGTHTPVLGQDGADLAAALQTIAEIGDSEALQQAIEGAFPGSSISISNTDGRFEIQMQQPGLLRPLKAAELSDGTLRYLLWIAALLTPRPPGLMVLNEPEASLHPDLLPALARLIADASARSQLIVVTHASRLVAALEAQQGCNSIVLDKEYGQTCILGANRGDAPAWQWPPR